MESIKSFPLANMRCDEQKNKVRMPYHRDNDDRAIGLQSQITRMRLFWRQSRWEVEVDSSSEGHMQFLKKII